MTACDRMAAYEAIKKALLLFDRGAADHGLAAACRRIGHPAARTAASMLHQGYRHAAQGVLSRALLRLEEAGA
jgi:hypothetical protein